MSSGIADLTAAIATSIHTGSSCHHRILDRRVVRCRPPDIDDRAGPAGRSEPLCRPPDPGLSLRPLFLPEAVLRGEGAPNRREAAATSLCPGDLGGDGEMVLAGFRVDANEWSVSRAVSQHGNSYVGREAAETGTVWLNPSRLGLCQSTSQHSLTASRQFRIAQAALSPPRRGGQSHLIIYTCPLPSGWHWTHRTSQSPHRRKPLDSRQFRRVLRPKCFMRRVVLIEPTRSCAIGFQRSTPGGRSNPPCSPT
jgi:hypothetical protein